MIKSDKIARLSDVRDEQAGDMMVKLSAVAVSFPHKTCLKDVQNWSNYIFMPLTGKRVLAGD